MLAIPDGRYGGAQLRALDFVRELRPTAEIVVVSPVGGPVLPAFASAGAKVEILTGKPKTMLDRVFVDHPVDVVLAETLLCQWAIHAAAQAGIPSVFEVHESQPISEFLYSMTGGEEELELATAQCTDALALADVVVVAHDHLANYLAHWSRRRPEVIPTGIDVDDFRSRLVVAHGARESGANSRLCVLCVGSGAPHKGQAVLLRALDLLGPSVNIETTLIGVGDNSYVDSMRNDLWASGRSGVTLEPSVPDPAPWFATADVLVCPSYTETFPGVVLEARVAGMPVVASDLPGTRAAAGDYTGIIWVPAGNAAGIAEALRELLSGQPAREPAGDTVPTSSQRAERLLELVSELRSA